VYNGEATEWGLDSTPHLSIGLQALSKDDEKFWTTHWADNSRIAADLLN